MRKAVLITISLLVLTSLAGAEKFITVPLVEPTQDVSYRDDAFIINLTASTGKIRVSPQTAATGQFGIPALDALALKFGIDKVEALFPEADLALVSAGVPDMSRYYRISFDSRASALQDVLAEFSKSTLVETAEPIGVHRVNFSPNDTYYAPGQAFGYQWDMEQQSDQDVDASGAWDINKGSTNIVVGDLDTGFRYYHKDLGGDNWTGGPSATGTTGNIWINTLDPVDGADNDGNGRVDDHIGYDFVSGGFLCASGQGEDCSTPDNDPTDFNGHGTHTAGTIAAITNNARGVAGMAGGDAGGSPTGIGNGCKIMTLRIGWHATDGNGYVSMDYAAQALNYAAAVNNNPSQTAKVCAVNCSWGSSSLSALQTAIQNAVAAGILICKAAGNSNTQTADFLNAKGGDTTMSVAATDSFDVKASFSSYGTWVDVSAPGVDIISTYHVNTDPANDYVAKASGTSMSAPHVAGLAGLLKSENSLLTRSQVSDLIKNNTDNIDAQNPSFIGRLGTGRINAQSSLVAASPCFDANPPSVAVSAPNGGEDWQIGTTHNITWNATDDCGITQSEIRLDRQNDGVYEEQIAVLTGNPGSYAWTVTASATTLAKIQVTVTDGASNSSPDASDATFTISQSTTPTLHVSSIVVDRIADRGQYRGRATVTILDQNFSPAANATVAGIFTGPNSSTKSGTTDANGVAVILSNKKKNPVGSWCFQVTNVTKSGYTYDPGQNVETSDCEGGGATSVSASAERSELRNYPNPFNANTAISYYVPRDAQVSLEVYNIRGQKVKILVNEYQSTGSRTIFWDGTNSNGDVVASGVYFYKLAIDRESVTKKMTFLR